MLLVIMTLKSCNGHQMRYRFILFCICFLWTNNSTQKISKNHVLHAANQLIATITEYRASCWRGNHTTVIGVTFTEQEVANVVSI